VNFSVALTRKGEVYTWGGNQHGQLGTGTTASGWSPARVAFPRGAKVAAIAAGADHVVAITTFGVVYTWGHNHRGQIGDGSTADRHEPVAVTKGIKGLVSIVAAGNGISAAVTKSGDLYLWGRNTFGQLGVEQPRDSAGEAVSQTRPAKVPLPRGTDAVAVAAGNRHVTVALNDGRLVVFGLDAAGRPAEGTIRLKPSWGRPVRLAAGEDFTLVLTNHNVLLSFGGNASGQLGVGDHSNRLQPTPIVLPHATGHVRDIIACARGAAALTSTGEVYSWGDGNVGQHGAGTDKKALAVRPTPARVKALTGARVTRLHGGHHHAFVSVESGPPAALRVLPSRATTAPDVAVAYRAHKLDVFGTDLGPASHITFSVTDGRVVGNRVSARTLGVHKVTARSGQLKGSTILTVSKGSRP
jgi:alpha-tubulin suppressor-like RCC1 family protein